VHQVAAKANYLQWHSTSTAYVLGCGRVSARWVLEEMSAEQVLQMGLILTPAALLKEKSQRKLL
jgi:hypothetical protein